MALWSAGCNSIIEEPINGGVDPTLVQMNLSLAVDPSIGLYNIQRSADTRAGDQYDVRWIIEVFRDKIDGTPVESRILSCDPAADGNHAISTTFDLNAAKYHVVAWMDYVDDGSTDDKYYNIDALSTIHIPDAENYVGDEEHKDAFVARKEFDLSGFRDQWNQQIGCAMTLERPMAQIEFITTDLDEFLGNASGQSLRTPADIASIKVSVNYEGYFPSGFNAYTDKPNDAQTGVSFECPITQLSDSEAHLAGDHVFVNGSESAVTVTLVIRDGQNNIINEIGGINVPIVRGKKTVIRDDFFTKSYSPGIGIDPGFDGDIDIVIPD